MFKKYNVEIENSFQNLSNKVQYEIRSVDTRVTEIISIQTVRLSEADLVTIY